MGDDTCRKHEALESTIRDMHEKINLLILLMQGNGTPERGFVLRLDRLEQLVMRICYLTKVLIGLVIGVAVGWITYRLTRG